MINEQPASLSDARLGSELLASMAYGLGCTVLSDDGSIAAGPEDGRTFHRLRKHDVVFLRGGLAHPDPEDLASQFDETLGTVRTGSAGLLAVHLSTFPSGMVDWEAVAVPVYEGPATRIEYGEFSENVTMLTLKKSVRGQWIRRFLSPLDSSNPAGAHDHFHSSFQAMGAYSTCLSMSFEELVGTARKIIDSQTLSPQHRRFQLEPDVIARLKARLNSGSPDPTDDARRRLAARMLEDLSQIPDDLEDMVKAVC